MSLKDKVIHIIIPYAMGAKEFDEKKFELEMRQAVKYYLGRKQYAEIEEVLSQIDKNIDISVENVEIRKKMHNVIRRLRNFAHLYRSLSR